MALVTIDSGYSHIYFSSPDFFPQLHSYMSTFLLISSSGCLTAPQTQHGQNSSWFPQSHSSHSLPCLDGWWNPKTVRSSSLFFLSHSTSSLSKSCWLCHRNISRICLLPPLSTATTLAHLHSCDSLIIGSPASALAVCSQQWPFEIRSQMVALLRPSAGFPFPQGETFSQWTPWLSWAAPSFPLLPSCPRPVLSLPLWGLASLLFHKHTWMLPLRAFAWSNLISRFTLRPYWRVNCQLSQYLKIQKYSLPSATPDLPFPALPPLLSHSITIWCVIYLLCVLSICCSSTCGLPQGRDLYLVYWLMVTKFLGRALER